MASASTSRQRHLRRSQSRSGSHPHPAGMMGWRSSSRGYCRACRNLPFSCARRRSSRRWQPGTRRRHKPQQDSTPRDQQLPARAGRVSEYVLVCGWAAWPNPAPQASAAVTKAGTSAPCALPHSNVANTIPCARRGVTARRCGWQNLRGPAYQGKHHGKGNDHGAARAACLFAFRGSRRSGTCTSVGGPTLVC